MISIAEFAWLSLVLASEDAGVAVDFPFFSMFTKVLWFSRRFDQNVFQNRSGCLAFFVDFSIHPARRTIKEKD